MEVDLYANFIPSTAMSLKIGSAHHDNMRVQPIAHWTIASLYEQAAQRIAY